MKVAEERPPMDIFKAIFADSDEEDEKSSESSSDIEDDKMEGADGKPSESAIDVQHLKNPAVGQSTQVTDGTEHLTLTEPLDVSGQGAMVPQVQHAVPVSRGSVGTADCDRENVTTGAVDAGQLRLGCALPGSRETEASDDSLYGPAPPPAISSGHHLHNIAGLEM